MHQDRTAQLRYLAADRIGADRWRTTMLTKSQHHDGHDVEAFRWETDVMRVNVAVSIKRLLAALACAGLLAGCGIHAASKVTTTTRPPTDIHTMCTRSVPQDLAVSPSVSPTPGSPWPTATGPRPRPPTPFAKERPTGTRTQIHYVLTREERGPLSRRLQGSPASGCVLSMGTFGTQTDLTPISVPVWLIRLRRRPRRPLNPMSPPLSLRALSV